MHRVDTSMSRFPVPAGPPLSPGPEVCEICFSDLVQPMDAEAQKAGTVRLTLRCPECHHVRIGECTWDEAREFGRRFAAGRHELRRLCEELAEETFRDEIESFVIALHTGLLGPDDFTPFRYFD